jgi:monovalent cation:H+ antiporter-2, CPA2 family
VLVIAVPDAFQARQMIEVARALKPDIGVIVRAHSDEEAALLRRDSAGNVFTGEHELALAMTRRVLETVAATQDSTREREPMHPYAD